MGKMKLFLLPEHVLDLFPDSVYARALSFHRASGPKTTTVVDYLEVLPRQVFRRTIYERFLAAAPEREEKDEDDHRVPRL